MKKIAANIGLILMMLVILGCAFYATIGKIIRQGHQLQHDIVTQKGKSVVDAKRGLGEPFRTTEIVKYMEDFASYKQSLEPDPPNVECEQVLEYQQFATVGMLFINRGIVVETYVGGT